MQQLLPELLLTAQHRLAAAVSGRLGPEDPAPNSLPRIFLRNVLVLYPDIAWQVEVEERREKDQEAWAHWAQYGVQAG